MSLQMVLPTVVACCGSLSGVSIEEKLEFAGECPSLGLRNGGGEPLSSSGAGKCWKEKKKKLKTRLFWMKRVQDEKRIRRVSVPSQIMPLMMGCGPEAMAKQAERIRKRRAEEWSEA